VRKAQPALHPPPTSTVSSGTQSRPSPLLTSPHSCRGHRLRTQADCASAHRAAACAYTPTARAPPGRCGGRAGAVPSPRSLPNAERAAWQTKQGRDRSRRWARAKSVCHTERGRRMGGGLRQGARNVRGALSSRRVASRLWTARRFACYKSVLRSSTHSLPSPTAGGRSVLMKLVRRQKRNCATADGYVG
jgi:hypothetical protein